jgi:hypothetical protein
MSATRQLPRYKCHKEVWALKIKEVVVAQSPEDGEGDFEPGSVVIVPEDAKYARFIVGKDYAEKHKPHAGGYYVVYDDGYKSFSPAKAFEDGYTRL